MRFTAEVSAPEPSGVDIDVHLLDSLKPLKLNVRCSPAGPPPCPPGPPAGPICPRYSIGIQPCGFGACITIYGGPAGSLCCAC